MRQKSFQLDCLEELWFGGGSVERQRRPWWCRSPHSPGSYRRVSMVLDVFMPPNDIISDLIYVKHGFLEDQSPVWRFCYGCMFKPCSFLVCYLHFTQFCLFLAFLYAFLFLVYLYECWFFLFLWSCYLDLMSIRHYSWIQSFIALTAAVELTWSKVHFVIPCEGICVLMLCRLISLCRRYNCGGLESCTS